MIEHYLVAASSFAKDIDDLILLIAVLVGFWFLLSQAVFFGFIFKFRHREGQKAQYITGELKAEKKWINWPHGLVLICDILIVVAAIRVWVDVKQTLPPPDAEIRVIGQQWSWTFQHPGPDNKLDTPDDVFKTDELHVQLDKTYHFHLESKDVLHSFSVPVFRLKQDAVPGRTITGWFKPTVAGEYSIQGAGMCCIGHGIMAARIFIEKPEQHAAWLLGEQTKYTQLNPEQEAPDGR